MDEQKCKKIASLYGKRINKNFDESRMIQELNLIMVHIDDNILKHVYESEIDAKNRIPKDATYLLNFIRMYHVFITHCNKSHYKKLVYTFMCKNDMVLCKIYHLLANWGLYLIGCMKVFIDKSLTTFILKDMYNTDMLNNNILKDKNTEMNIIKDIKPCINNITNNVSANNLRLAYYLLSSALYLREEFLFFCDKKVDTPHQRFNKLFKNDVVDELENKLIQKSIKFKKFKFL